VIAISMIEHLADGDLLAMFIAKHAFSVVIEKVV